MTEEEIIELFKIEIEKPGFKVRAGINKQQHYNYRHRVKKLSLMIDILYRVGAIKITKA